MTYITELAQILADERAVYEQLLELARRKGEAIVHKRMNDVRDLQQFEVKLAARVEELEPQRQELVRKLCGACGFANNSGHVSLLVAHLGECAEPLRRTAADLRDIISRLQQANAENAARLRENIDCLQGAFNAFRQVRQRREVYTASGERAVRPLVVDGTA